MTVFDKFMEMIKQSWTWARLTDDERFRVSDLLEHCYNYKKLLSRSESKQYEMLHLIYNAFLEGCGYQPFGWREDKVSIND